MQGGRDWAGVCAGLAGAAFVLLWALFGRHQASPAYIEQRLAALGGLALEVNGLAFARLDMVGQKAVLTGAAPSAAAAARAERAVLKAAGPGGAWAGGVTAVEARFAPAAGAPPARWIATSAKGEVRFSGAAPSEAARAALRRRAQSLFPAGVRDEATAPAKARPDPAWIAAAQDALAQIATLQTGEARLEDRRLVILGEGAEEAARAVRAHYAEAASARFETVVDVTVTGQGLAGAIPELAGINLASAKPEQCQEAFTRIMARNVITFDTGSAVIADASRRAIDAVAAVARRCDRYAIEIAGHTDSRGAPGVNLALSQARAEAVRDYLAGQGVARTRLKATGFGAERPAASNATARGQAANRRIEFSVRT